MANQWGRDSDVPTRGRRRGLGLVAVIVALLLGGAGGFIASRALDAGGAGLNLMGQDTAAGADEALAAARRQIEELGAARDRDAAEIGALKDTIARQASELDAMAEKLAAAAPAGATPDAAELDAVTRERDRLQSQVAALTEQTQVLEARIAARDADRGEGAARAEAEIARLTKELAQLRDETIPQLAAERDRAEADLETVRGELEKARASQAAQTATIADLKRQLAAAEAAAAGVPAAAPAKGSPSGTVADAPDAEPRDGAAVSAALRAAPGLDALTDRQRRKLEDALVSGACVTDSLAAVFDRVPLLTLRNLIRDLNSPC
ncbi:hypothetical protein [Hoeflea olei]|uniref:Uncharacterized protein n=1 Tax=Hoeflea olei TaxID=1480615 RepID=A0A1C1YZG0_9HYPH|nr:hypothetical protein [Hoeflea olei]OCW58796.1 hypothetical protein AWJ14_20615 [Hoeflea olei]